jgi:deazaflavin-dependent oxidoreductase (nitroreductase family)
MQHFDPEILDAANQAREIELSTYGRQTGQPHRVIMWIWGDGTRLYVRSGQGLRRDWPQNLLANPRAVLHVAGKDVPVRTRLVTDPAEARAGSTWLQQKYHTQEGPSPADGPLTPGETANFELLPDDGTDS